jgi:ubiquinone/menaquinone biosynthesis C-methylase UbiE
MSILDHFGLLAPFYDRIFPTVGTAEWTELLNPPIGSRLLDVGGGTGRIAGALQAGTALTVVADASLDMLKVARGKIGLSVVCCEAEALPFPGGSFDNIIMVDAFHHVADQSQSVEGMWQLLKKGGTLVIEEPDIQTFSIKIVAFLEKVALMRSHIIPAKEIGSLFKDPLAIVTIKKAHHTAWIVVKKSISPPEQNE